MNEGIIWFNIYVTICVKDQDAIVQAAVPAQGDSFNQGDSHLNREEKENIILSF